MPKSIIKSETKWKEAKKKASEQGQGKNYPYIMAIYQRMSDTPFKGNINTNRKDFITQSKKFKDEYDQIHNVVGEVIPNKRISTPISGLTLAGKKIFFKPKERKEDKMENIRNYILNTFLENKIPGGLADNVSDEDIAKKHNVSLEFIKKQIKKGVEHEMEHTSDPEIALEISRDHVFSKKNYYDLLDKIEH
jgi:hypothetical protein